MKNSTEVTEEPKQNTESLHQILQNETEKIVRWKVSTEVCMNKLFHQIPFSGV